MTNNLGNSPYLLLSINLLTYINRINYLIAMLGSLQDPIILCLFYYKYREAKLQMTIDCNVWAKGLV